MPIMDVGLQKPTKEGAEMAKGTSQHDTSSEVLPSVQDYILFSLCNITLMAEKTASPREVLRKVTQELGKLGFTACIYWLDDAGENASLTTSSLSRGMVGAAEKLIGCKMSDLKVPVDKVTAFKDVVRRQKTVTVNHPAEILAQALPTRGAKRHALTLETMLGFRQTIFSPLVMGDRVAGVLGVSSESLAEDDENAIAILAQRLSLALQKASLL
jgi:GAF domain-containing protein